jgi:hypothetical protein
MAVNVHVVIAYISSIVSPYLHFFSATSPTALRPRIYTFSLNNIRSTALFPPTQPRPRIIPLLLTLLLLLPRPSTLCIPSRSARVRTLTEVTVVLLRRRSRRWRRRYVALRYILAPLVLLLLLLLRRLTPWLVLLVLRRRWREELLVRWR